MTSAAGREGFLRNNSLACYLVLLSGERVTVELRNESSVSGTIVHADGFMNISLEDVVYVTPKGSEKKFDSFQVSGRHVRFVQLPPDVKPCDELKRHFRASNAARLKAKVDSTKQAPHTSRLLLETRFLREEFKRNASGDQPGPSTE